MFLYARAVHSNHSIQYHMHQIMEQQKVIDEYRNMMMEGLDLIPLESNLHPCMFVGYADDHTKDVYRFLNNHTKRIILSRDVRWLNVMWKRYKKKS